VDEVSAGVSALGMCDKVHGGGGAPAPGGGEIEAGGLPPERGGIGIEDIGAGGGDAIVDLDVVGSAIHAAEGRGGC